MNKKISIGIGFAFVVFFAEYVVGILILRQLADTPDTAPEIMLAVFDGSRLIGPIIGGYIVGRTLGRHGLLAGFLFAFVGFAVVESVGHPPWYYDYGYFLYIAFSFFNYFGIPAALAGGCGQLHATLKAQRRTP
jgi:hypothetical protein